MAKALGQSLRAASERPAPRPEPRIGGSAARPEPRKAVASRAPGPPDSSLGKAERRILAALVQYPSGRTKRQVALLAGYAINGGGFGNALGALRTKGLIDGYDTIRITDVGVSALGGDWVPLPTGEALLEHWMGQLGKAERAILHALTHPPRVMTKEQLAEAAGYEPNGGGFGNALGRLRTLELIEGRGELRASEDLFA